MSEGRIKRRWIEWNLLGMGKSYSPMYGAKYSYRGVVLYAHEWPIGRLVRGPGKSFINLYRGNGYVGVDADYMRLWSSVVPRLVAVLHVEDLGVYSKFPDDMIDEPTLHDRCRELFLKEATWLLQRADEVPDAALVDSGKYYWGNGEQLIKDMRKLEARYVQHTAMFRLNWSDFPPMYLRTLESVVERRAMKYLSDKEVAKRERKEARKEARIALGLEKY